MTSIIRVNLTDQSVSQEESPEEYALLGGRALTSHIVLREVEPRCDPLGPESKLVFAPGLLGGTAATTSGRTSFGGKSPLMGGCKEANVGGTLGHRLSKLGIKAVVIEGAPADDTWRILRIDGSGARLEPAPDGLAGLGTYETVERLLDGGLRSTSVVCIGPAGEQRLGAASIAVNDPEGRPTRHAARGGLGALMGAQCLKAIVVNDDGTRYVEAADKDAYRELVTGFSKTTLEDPRTKNMGALGTAGVLGYVNREQISSLPTRNHRFGTFATADRISGRRIGELAPERGGKMLPCMAGCIIKCAILFNDADGEHLTTALEFETISLLGANLEIDNLEAVARMDRLCDDLGLDTIETGNAFGVAMEAGVAEFGDWQAAIGLFDEIRQGTELGRLLCSGTVAVARHFGIDRVPAIKGMGMPAWEPRTLKAMGITYATSPQGADHTAGLVTARGVTEETYLKASRHEQVLQAAVDSVGLCQFSNPTAEDMAKFVSAQHGVSWSADDALALGKRCLLDEREFNLAAGFGRDADEIPSFLRTEPLETPDGNAVFDLPDDLIDSFWDDL
ncbi:MAG: aldehyde ferredoxin oxidoreductase [Chloroflexi bacterium]|nr:aldehyde ferredoxin oxidoreductase [Chloroflexota bacterium]